jgi:hypothetical protein
MSYSRQSSNGVVVENKDGEVYVNGTHIESGKRSLSYHIFIIVVWGVFFILGYMTGAM